MANLNAFDWILILIVAVSTIRAFARGLIRVIFSIAGLMVGLVVASQYYQTVADSLSPWIHSVETAELLSFLLLLFAVIMAFATVAAVVRRTVAAVGLGPIDRVLGALFGLLRGGLIAMLLLTVTAAFVPDSTLAKNSQLAPYFLESAHALSFVVPEHFQKQIADGANLLLQRAPGTMRTHSLEWTIRAK